MKPALLLDVDGVLCPFGGANPPEGYKQLQMADHWVWISDANAERIKRLQSYFEIVWCTAWEHDANTHLLEPHRIDVPLEVITFQTDHEAGLVLKAGDETWKLPWVKRWAKDRPLAWVDDDIGADARRWASERVRNKVPTMLVSIAPELGLLDIDVEAMVVWAEGVADA